MTFFSKNIWKICENLMYICSLKFTSAEIAQLVEHDLAKVGVASSSLVFRSKKLPIVRVFFSEKRP